MRYISGFDEDSLKQTKLLLIIYPIIGILVVVFNLFVIVESNGYGLLILQLSFLVILFGVFLISYFHKRNKIRHKKYLLENGTPLKATITDVVDVSFIEKLSSFQSSFSRTSKYSPRFTISAVSHDNNGREISFYSEQFDGASASEIKKILESHNLNHITICINTNNPRDYVFDISEINDLINK